MSDNIKLSRQASHFLMNGLLATNAEHFKNTRGHNLHQDIHDKFMGLPNYRELFGSQRSAACDHDSSLYSAAAYFVDLMRLIEAKITSPKGLSLNERRPDLVEIPLDAENTNTEVPYLTIVNEVLAKALAKKLGDSQNAPETALRALATESHPSSLPFNAPLEEIRAYLKHFNIDLASIYELFQADPIHIARERLGLSVEEYTFITKLDPTDEELSKAYGVVESEFGEPNKGSNLLVKAGFTHHQLEELFYQGVTTGNDSVTLSNISAELGELFVHRYQSNRVAIYELGKSGGFTRWIEDSGWTPQEYGNAWKRALKLLLRFIRLATRLQWSFADLDWALNSIRTVPASHEPWGTNWTNVDDIDEGAITNLAKIKTLMDRYELPVDVACCFWSDMKTSGKGDGRIPKDLFSRTFGRDETYFPIAKEFNEQHWGNYYWAENQRIWTWLRAALKITNCFFDISDQTSAENQKVRAWLRSALKIDNSDLALIVDFAKENHTLDTVETLEQQNWVEADLNANGVPLTVHNLTCFYRLRKLATILGLHVSETLLLLELLDKKQLATIDDLLEVTDYAAWLKTAGLTVYQLQYMTSGELNPYVDAGYAEAGVRPMLEELSRAALKKGEQAQTETVVQTLATFFGAKPDISKYVFKYFLDEHTQKAFVDSILAFRSDDTNAFTAWRAKNFQVFKTLARGFYAARLLGLTANEVKSIAEYQEWYDISRIQKQIWPARNIRSMHIYKRLASTWQKDNENLGGFLTTMWNFKEVIGECEYRLAKTENELQREQRQSELVEYLESFSKIIADKTIWERYQLSHLMLDPSFRAALMNQKLPQIGMFVAIKACFDVATLMGVDISVLLRVRDLASLKPLALWQSSLDIANDPEWQSYCQTAEELLAAIKAKYEAAQWLTIYASMLDRLNEQKRDALTRALMRRLNQDPIVKEAFGSISTLEDLSKYLLMDVEMGSCTEISKVKLGLNSLQLYIHRCRNGLEPWNIGEIPEQLWSWMSHYRVWEANRKVFLYPENYLDPSLRKRKTPLFAELQGELLQGDITAEAVTKAYTNYFDKFEKLTRLDIVGSYYCPVVIRENGENISANTLFLIGRTDTQPHTFYCRTAEFEVQAELPIIVNWTPWQQIDLTINAGSVTPVFAFQKLFLFWVEQSVEKQTKSIFDDEGMKKDVKFEITKASVKYSFHNVSGKWAAPQPLASVQDYPIHVTTSDIDAEIKTLVKRLNVLVEKANLKGEELDRMKSYVAKNQAANSILIMLPGVIEQYLKIIAAISSTNDDFKKILQAEKEPHERLEQLHVLRQKLLDGYDDSVVENDVSAPLWQNVHCRFFETESKVLATGLGSFVINSEVIYLQYGSKSWVLNADLHESKSTPEQFALFDTLSRGSPYTLSGRYLTSWGATSVSIHLGTSVIHELNRIFMAGGLDHLLTPDSQRLGIDFDGPYGDYFWEIFFHIPFLIASALNTNQRFEEAQKWYQYIFNPTAKQEPEGNHEADRFWRFLPFRERSLDKLKQMLTNPQALSVYEDDPFDPDAIARLRIGAYEKAIVMRYIDNLLDWGDNLFAQDTWESIAQASMLYVQAADLLGKRPVQTASSAKRDTRNFNTIDNKIIEMIDAGGENELVEKLNVEAGSSESANYVPFQLGDLAYFCLPENDEFIQYWDRVADRLYKIRHCMNISGIVRQLALFEPPIDPRQLIRALALGGTLDDALSQIITPVPHYRFAVMLQQARSLTASLSQLGASLVAALEKKDAAELSRLHAGHEKVILDLTTRLKEQQIDEAGATLAALNKSLDNATTRRDHYTLLLSAGLSEYETTTIEKMDSALNKLNEARDWRVAAVIANLIPTIYGLADGGFQPGPSISEGAQLLDADAGIANHSASMATTQGQNARRKEEWELSLALVVHDIEQINQQIAASTIGQAVAQMIVEIHNKTIEQAGEMDDYLKRRFGTEELYQWMIGRIAGIYNDTYNLALQQARAAQRAYQFERNTDATFINPGYSDTLHMRLLAGEELMSALEHMEVAYREDHKRELEIEKTISLLQLDPQALLDLKAKGTCDFKLSEQLFDYDFPGHYCRKIASVAISIPAIVGPYQNVQASLVQQTNCVVLTPEIDTVNYLLSPERAKQAMPGPDRCRSNLRAVQQIAISKGVNDAGIFELNFHDERYLPFEGTGAVSSWKLTMPKATNRIDFNSISDVIIHLRYTALDGGDAFRTEVTRKPQVNYYSGIRFLSLRQECFTDWQKAVASSSESVTLALTVNRSMFPVNLKAGTIALGEIVKPVAENAINTDNKITQLDLQPSGELTSLTLTIIPADQKMDQINRTFIAQEMKGETWSVSISTTKEKFNSLTDIVLILPYTGELDWMRND